jgi:hypothetical protein
LHRECGNPSKPRLQNTEPVTESWALNRRPVLAATFYLVCALAGRVAAQENDLAGALGFVAKAGEAQELIREAASAKYNTAWVREGVWYAAALGSLEPKFSDDIHFQRLVMRTGMFATLLEIANRSELAKWPSDEQLYDVGPQSMQALGRYGAIDQRREPIDALLARRPEVTEGFWRGYYRLLRLGSRSGGEAMTLEKSDTPWRDLGREWKVTQRGPDGTAEKEELQEGASYSFPLEALNHIVIVAKMYLCVSLLQEQNPARRYPLIIAANSLYAASEATGPRLAQYAQKELGKAISLTPAQPNSDGKLLTRDVLQTRLTSMHFFGRNLSAALRDYRTAAAATHREAEYRLWGEWGTGVVLFGLRDSEASTHFRRVAAAVKQQGTSKASGYRYMLGTLHTLFGGREILGDADEALMSEVDTWRGASLPPGERSNRNLDLLRILFTIGRYEAAASLLMLEIPAARKQGTANARETELHYLRELGATLNEVIELLSWVVDADGNESLRTGPLDVQQRDFPKAYAMSSAEEDRAVCWEMYETEPTRFKQWVDHELKRQPPNVKPLLKAAFIEWFFAPLASLSKPDTAIASWCYRPAAMTGLTSVADMHGQMLRAADSVDEHTTRVWKVFSDVRTFLTKTYGGDNAK